MARKQQQQTGGEGGRSKRCPCESAFPSSDQVLSAIQSDAATTNLVTWLRGQEVREEGEEFVLIRRVSADDQPHADSYGRCPARVGAAFAILNAIRDGCRSHLDRQQSTVLSSSSSLLAAETAAATASSSPAAVESKTSPAKPRYEDDFPSLSSSSAATAATISTTSSTVASANVLIPRKKKKKQPQQQPQQPAKVVSSIDAHRNNFPTDKSTKHVHQQPQQSRATSGKKSFGNAQKKRIRPVPLTATQSSSSQWPAASSSSVATLASDVIKRGNIANLPSEDPLVSVAKSPSSKGSKSCWGGNDVLDAAVSSSTITTIGFGAAAGSQASMCAATRPPPDFDQSAQDTVAEIDGTSLNRIVDIYTTLILCQLVPSVPLELHLLVRLLSLNTNTSAGSNTVPSETTNEYISEGMMEFRRVFHTAQICRDFAARALTELETPILSSLGQVVLRKLVALPSMNEVLPEVVGNLHRIAGDGGRVLNRADSLEGAVAVMSISGASNTPFLTVPFNENRDSRHNYRGRDRSLLFNNREESRDKFMFQLRAFQEIRGTVLDPAQAQVYISDIKVACREMIHGLLPDNMGWFAGLFSDLLLQIGLVAVEETDKDVLKQVADKDRLKKLHRRFTAKSGQKNRSSQRLVLDNNSKSASSASSTSLQPEHYFSGHQEFFFIFLRAVDSYRFGIHLRQRLVGLINEMNSTTDSRGLESRVLRIQLLAKFLGMLVFSPKWNNSTSADAASKSNVAMAEDSKEALAHLNCTAPIIRLREYIEESWRTCRLVVTIPWVVEFLRMASWDSVSLQASYYQKVFALLRSIHRRLGQTLNAECLSSNLELVMFQLEVLFADVIGLVKAERLPLVVLPERKPLSIPDAEDDNVVRLDSIPFHFTNLYLFSSSSYLEEFYKLISELVEKKGKAVGRAGASKKLRPCAITAAESNSSLFSKQVENANGTLVAGSSPLSPPTLISPQKGVNHRRNNNSIQEKLVDAFFHQHNDLQQVCEFVVERSIKNALTIVVNDHIAPNFAVTASNFDDTFDLFLKVIRQKEQHALAAARHEMKSQCVRMARESIELLSPQETKPAVLDIATKLAIQHAQEKGEEHILSIVRQEAQKRIDEYIKAEATKKRAKPAARSAVANEKATATTSTNDLAHDLRAATAVLERARCNGAPYHVSQSTQTLFYDLSESLSTRQSRNAPWNEYCLIEEEGRKFISSLLAVLSTWFSVPSDERAGYPPLFLDAITISMSLARVGVPYYGLKRIGKYVCENARQLVEWDEQQDNGIGSEVGINNLSPRGQASIILRGMLDAQMITPRLLDAALVSVHNRKAGRVL